ncbi:uncharacterized protein C15orf39 homolog [Prinia subflava]|uniref:uncharacterized protein C15orf39 homolog n=1 Tax=Prinia subflava TaxID=208062 RepID=UPI002FE22D5B
MASKRCSQAAEPVIVTKLPRPEPAAALLPGKIPGTPSPVARPGSENHFSYRGSYFACPLQSPECPEQPPAGWSPAPAHLHCGPGAPSQPVPAEGALLGLLPYPPGSPGTRLQPPDTQRSKDSLSQEQLMARKKLHSPRCSLPVKKAPPLAPKPVYGAPASFLAPRMTLLLRTQAESLQQQPGEANWALPPATHPLHPSEPHKRGPCSEHRLQMLPSSLALPSKEQLGSPVALPHCCVTFDKYGPPPSTPLLEGSCPPAQSQKKVLEAPSLSLEPWPKLQPPDTSPVTRERSAMCYPPPPYPLSPHRAGPLCHPPVPAVGEPSALPAFGYVGSREPFPSTYLKPQAPRSYFPSPLEPYVPRTGGARLGAVLGDAEAPRDAELPWNTGYPGFAVSPGDASVFQPSFPGMEPSYEQQWQAALRHSSAFQPVCTSEKLSGGCGGLTETFPERGGDWEKLRQGEEALYPGRRNSSLAPQDSPHGGPGEGNVCMAKDPAKELIHPSPSLTPTQALEDLRDTRALSSSPPMPVIHNVFSLAPYQEFLERARGSDPILFCRKHLWEDSSPQNTAGSQEPAALRDISVVPSLRLGDGAVQSQEESYRSTPKKPKPEPQELESQEGSPDGVDTEEPIPEDMVLDLSFKKRLVETEDTQRPTECAEGTLDQEEKEEKEAAEGKVGLGEGAQPRMPEADSGDRSSFQSSATFMFQKYKRLPSVPPSTEPPQQDGSPHAPQPSPPSSTPTPAHPAPSPSSAPTPAHPAPSPSSVPTLTHPAPSPSSAPTPAHPAPSPSSAPTPAHPAPSPSSAPTPAHPAPSPSSAPTPAHPAPSPSSAPTFPLPGPQLSIILAPNPPQTLLLTAPSTPVEEKAPEVKQDGGHPTPTRSGQNFTTLHTVICDTISDSVSRSSPELLRQWLEKAELAEELGEVPKSLPKPKSGSKAPNPQKPSNGKEIWLAFQDVSELLIKLLSQMHTFMLACPFPHVVRAGTIFIPIHVVKEKLFPKLPGSFVDQVLQKHKVELRPTTLSEEKHLRDLELKSCTCRMLKLLALKQLPEIYPDLLNLHWHNSIWQQLGSSSETGQQPSK